MDGRLIKTSTTPQNHEIIANSMPDEPKIRTRLKLKSLSAAQGPSRIKDKVDRNLSKDSKSTCIQVETEQFTQMIKDRSKNKFSSLSF